MGECVVGKTRRKDPVKKLIRPGIGPPLAIAAAMVALFSFATPTLALDTSQCQQNSLVVVNNNDTTPPNIADFAATPTLQAEVTAITAPAIIDTSPPVTPINTESSKNAMIWLTPTVTDTSQTAMDTPYWTIGAVLPAYAKGGDSCGTALPVAVVRSPPRLTSHSRKEVSGWAPSLPEPSASTAQERPTVASQPWG